MMQYPAIISNRPNKPRRYNRQFKQRVLQDLFADKTPVPEMARLLGIDQSILYRWKREFEISGVNIKEQAANMMNVGDEIMALRHDIHTIKKRVEQLSSIIMKVIQTKYVPEGNKPS